MHAHIPNPKFMVMPKRPPPTFSVAETSVAEMSRPKRPRPKCLWPKCPSTIPSLVTSLLSADNSLNPDQACQRIGPDLDPFCLTLL